MMRSLRSSLAPPASALRRRRLAALRAFQRAAFTALAAGAFSAAVRAQEPADLLLPDIIVRASDLYDHRVSSGLPNVTLLYFSNATANVGNGRLHIFGVFPPNQDGTIDVMQRVFRAGGGSIDLPAGRFVFHPAHDHIHLEDWCRYRLREVLPGGGVGPVLRESEKVSFCIVDLNVHDRSLPNFDPSPRYINCDSFIQGLSVGWSDLYDRTLPGQSIDITNLPSAVYWLESEVDPANFIRETDDTNNVARIQVTVGDPNFVPPDAFEPNDRFEDLESRPAGGTNSPNLGPCNPKRVVEDLSLHEARNADFFKFYSNDVGGPLDYVRIDYNDASGALDLYLYNESRAEVARSQEPGEVQTIILRDLPEGWYTVVVRSREGREPVGAYRLTINPPANEPPEIDVQDPPAGDTKRIHHAENYVVRWSASDPEGDLTWVSVFFNEAPILDGSEYQAATGRLVDGDLGAAVVNSAELPEGTYWVYCQVTDGGSTRGAWSAGTVTFLEFDDPCDAPPGSEGDCNVNNVIDQCEIDAGLAEDCDRNGIPDACEVLDPGKDRNANRIPDACEHRFHRGDANNDGDLDISDVVAILSFLFSGAASPPCLEAADVDNDGEIVITDGIFGLGYLFAGGLPPAEPGAPGSPCGVDPDLAGSGKALGCARYSHCED
jgi:hypothetical protein